MAISSVVADWNGDRYVNGNPQTLTQYMTKARVEANMNTDEYELAAFTLNTENGVNVAYRGKGYNFTVEITESGNSAKVTYEGEGDPLPQKEWTQEGDTITDGEVTLQVGDYINYDPISGASKTSETSYATSTGNEDDQVFNLASYTGNWVVFGVEDGNIQIISEDAISLDSGGYEDGGNTYYALYGELGLKNAVTELDKIASLYGQGQYAEPGYNLMKYGNEVSIFWDGTNRPKYESTLGGNGNLQNSHSDGFYWYNYETETMEHIDYTTTPSEEPIITITNDFYAYIPGIVDLGISEGTSKTVFQDSTGNNALHWLGSRYVYADPNYAYFGVCGVFDGRVVGYGLAYSDGYEDDYGAGVRPLDSKKTVFMHTKVV